MRKAALVVVAAVLAVAPVSAQQAKTNRAGLGGAATAARKSIDPLKIRAHVKFLSSDLLEGRGTGQRGGEIAAEYIATQFALYGLRPAGDSGGYLQKVPMVGITTEPSTTFALVPANHKPINLKLGEDAVASDETANPTDDLDSDLIFVGYGISAPEYNWDDYKGMDVKGKVLLMLVNEPPSDDPNFFKGKALTYYGRWTYKYEEAARRGAAGVILVHKTDMASYGWDVVKNSWGGETAYLRDSGQPKLKLASWIQLEIASKLLADSGQELDALLKQAQSREFKPVPLLVKVKAHMVNRIRPFDSANVVALLPGSDPALKRQAVFYTAHYDHLGIHPQQTGDNIYNGAIDNATGCGVLLELARAYASAATRPRRSVLFAAVTGEEQGLLGSEYLGQHPPVPAGLVALDLNFDAVAPRGVPEDIVVNGSDRTTFYPALQTTANAFHLQIKQESNPGAGYYYRSDHFSLARVGIPAFSVNEGLEFEGHPLQWGVEQEREYRQKHYHQPSDEFRADWDFSGVAKIAQFGFELGWEAANQAQEVQWLKGDEFEAVRKASLGGSAAQGAH